ncbi:MULTISPECIES: NAD(P)H-dependent glycerol-3-phosphate dehydrogenase [Marinobacter]|jgi:glycerol-3-phosphate dehydrogenase (NAD(P)+)|uniref:Glycerol-3-phosphate dehydrogenase [NAD(P)+] n=1 Tax=Marinobacter vinifirmus TaxID=355591 RepID=A0A259W3I5_9GAMM|nr:MULTISPECIES: NAD(P)H-dependent glycerol-3-phosphate dehydrogenase [Marinobacter]KRW82658.1 glycerol-3-phosphate dehydrogenase [Marinobacter sp. P4B1]OZC37114.1 glycerol-3-phosphate dehydrogenase [Marinobacter vinifirmus]TVT32804.1 MAG: NAD(P)H-dependent glycerol-3-phosphate dehydrogenase [Marinobacter vinifirmus]|tara:strand:+ start:479 stop:1540 length:1062 start_codon:yes stop_codon:yes gene_type:complete
MPENTTPPKDGAKSYDVAVLGGGSFGTAMAKVLGENGHTVHFWMRDEAQAEEVRRTRVNKRYMPDVTIEGDVQPTTDLAEAVARAEVVLVAIPSKAFRSVIRENADAFREGQIVVSLTKGIEEHGFKLMSEILMEELPRCRSGVLSGPNLAAEIVNRELTATVIAAKDPEVRRTVQDLLGCEYFRVYANVDVYGVELAGALKNIYAIVAGLASALEMGENARAMLITRGLAEMSRFAVSLGANPMTFMGLAGVGDLIATCTSNKSRNYRIGYAVGKGKQLDEAVKELGQVAEGIYTLKLVREKSESIGIYMPLVRGLYEILYNGASINAVISSLMMAVQNSDVEFILPRTITQ